MPPTPDGRPARRRRKSECADQDPDEAAIANAVPCDNWVDYRGSALAGPDAMSLGDEIYLRYVASQVDFAQTWAPPVRLLRYFGNFSKDTIARMARRGYVNRSYFQMTDARFAPTNDDMYHMATGGYGIVFRFDRYVVKFVFEHRNGMSEMDAATEYTVPRFLRSNLKGDAREFVVCALAMGINYRLGFLHSLYRRVLHTLLLLMRAEEGLRPSVEMARKPLLRWFEARKDSEEFVRLISYFYPSAVQSNVNLINNFAHLVHFFEHEKRARYVFDRGAVIVFPLARGSADSVSPAAAAEMGFASHTEFLKFVFLQIALLYLKIYEMPGCGNFLHVDLKPDNVLIFDSSRALSVTAAGATFRFEEPVRAALNDFDFARVAGIDNRKIAGSIRVPQNWFYDFHFFAHTLLRAYPNIAAEDAGFHAALSELTISCSRATCDRFRLRTSATHPIAHLARLVRRDIFSRWINAAADAPAPAASQPIGGADDSPGAGNGPSAGPDADASPS
ncbi:putative serine/threonine protein kinase [Parapoxvirus red deer/HL953]|uniref:Serine/threonine-protein kinase 2 n=1 Tax=Parapoxvirus red deer/HL953 TaxID=1579460 RepID=A0A0A7MEW7_9POXV|nr:putative serine/threonine protein kinase [Parapoxvirus red deer/HL953]AIZ77381.1 putative serine/threonine protein kinase [Parapoxvirus red deer/HL953]